MPFRTEKFITRAMVRSEPKTMFVFGDNMKSTGRGGQAAAMRGEPNTVGVPTKWIPSMTDGAFFTDEDFPLVRDVIAARLKILADHLNHGGNVVWPEDDVGSGRAELQKRAPKIHAFITAGRKLLEEAT